MAAGWVAAGAIAKMILEQIGVSCKAYVDQVGDIRMSEEVSFENIEHLQNPMQFLHGASQVLKPDGCLLISTPDRAFSPAFIDGKPSNPYHVMEWYEDEFREMLLNYFEDVSLLSQAESHAVAQWKHPGLLFYSLQDRITFMEG